MAKFFTPTRLSENIKETPEGYLLCCDVPIARTGWQEYGPGETPLEVGEDGRVWISREADEVFRPQTVASFNGKSVTIKHPEEFVGPKNWQQLTHGSAQNVRKGDEVDEDGEEMLLADLLITDEFAIGLVKNGLREVSCGYDAEYEQTADGEGRQFNIIGNHIALVEQGRAGTTYAIKDHKGKVTHMDLKSLAEKIKNLGKTVDEALSVEETESKKAEALAKAKKKSKTADEGAPEQVAYDELMKAVKDLGEKFEGMMGKKKADDEEAEHIEDEDEEKEKSKDSDEDEEVGQNSRLDKLEAAIAKILKVLGNKNAEDEDKESDEDMSGDEDMEESEDADMEGSEDEEAEEGEESQKKKMTGDAAHIEILTPGKKFTGKDARAKCLKEFAKTEDGAKVLKQLGIKKPVFDSKSGTDMIFMAASAIVKTKRGTGLAGTKDGSKWASGDGDNTNAPMTAEQMNEVNAKHYGAAK